MLLKVIFLTFLLNSATCRTAKNYREMAETARLSQAEFPQYNIIAPNGPGTYAFGYEIEDQATRNVQFRDEEKLANGSVIGSYGVLYPDDTLHITKYIADQLGYRANTEVKKKSNQSPLKVDLQSQPISREQPNYLASSSSPVRGQTFEYPFAHPNTPTPSYPTFIDTIRPTIDPIFAAQVYQQHQINLNPTYNPLRDPNILEPQIANAFLTQQYYVPQNNFLSPALRQSYDGTVSTYTPQNPQQPPWNFPFFNWLTGNNNNNYYNQNYQSDQVQTNRPVIDFFTNLANNNPLTNFFNNWGQNDNANTPVQNFFNNLNPLNFLNNNNRPQTSLPVTAAQSDYIPTSSMTQQPGTSFMQPSNNLDNSVFSNDHFLNPNTYYPNTPNNPQIVHSYYPNNHMLNRPQYQAYSAWPSQHNNHNHNHNRYPNNYYNNPYNPYNNYMQTMTPALTYNRKKTNSKRKKNKNKVDLETDSDWFQDFLDKRKEASVENSRRKTSSKDSDEDDEINLDEYFR